MQLFPAALAHRSLGYLTKNYRYAAKDPGFFAMKTLARFEFTRSLARRISSLPPPPPALPHPQPEVPAVVSDHDAAAAAQILEREGYYVGLRLEPSVLEALLQRVKQATCHGDRQRDAAFSIDQRTQKEAELGRGFKLASYLNQQETWAEFQAVRDAPIVRELCAAYFGTQPTYLRSEICWSFPHASSTRDKIACAQVFHCDINDFRTLKFFFYLTDTGPEDGPHTYIKKDSRGGRPLLHQLLGQRCASLPDEEIVRVYGPENVRTICGPAGTGFAGDPYYFHRGDPPTRGSRLLLQIEFGYRRYRTWYFPE